MLDRQHGKFIVECDACGEALETETADFDEARATMQREGWKIRKIRNVWIHGCPDCGVPQADDGRLL